MSLYSIAENALAEGLARELLEEFPAVARGRGWMVANLEHIFERIDYPPLEVEGQDEPVELPPHIREMWRCDVYGPSPYSEWHAFVGSPERTTLRTISSVVGSLESPTHEGLVLMARQFVEQAGL